MSGVPRMTQTTKRLRSEMGLKPEKAFAQKPRRFASLRALVPAERAALSPSPAVTLPPSASERSRACCRAYLRRPSAPNGAQRSWSRSRL